MLVRMLAIVNSSLHLVGNLWWLSTAVPQLFRTAQAEDSQWVPSSLVRDNRREFRLRTN